MKRTLLLLALALSGAFAFAQELPTIAVFPFEDKSNVFTGDESVLFYRRFSNEFVNRNKGRFRVVPRQNVEKLINTEMAFQLSDFSAKVKTAEMNRVLNGSQILSGYIGRMEDGKISISVSLFAYPDMEQLPGGVDRDVANKSELFARIPELVQSMMAAIAESESMTGGGNAGGGTGVYITGYTFTERNQRVITAGLRDAIQRYRINLDIDSKSKSGYGFTVEMYSEPFVSYGADMIKAEATVVFSRNGQPLCRSAAYNIVETDENMVARRIAERLKSDRAFFDKVSQAIH